MPKLFNAAIYASVLLTLSEPAHACRDYDYAELSDVKFADIVLIGRLSNYHIIRDEDFRRKMLSQPDLPDDSRKLYADPKGGIITDYARFDVQVDERLKGQTPNKISVTWDNSTFGEPEQLNEGSFLIALRAPTSPIPPLRGPSATIFPNREPGLFTVLQAPCAAAFLFDAQGKDAQAIRNILAKRP